MAIFATDNPSKKEIIEALLLRGLISQSTGDFLMAVKGNCVFRG
jgi:hypothetical protein